MTARLAGLVVVLLPPALVLFLALAPGRNATIVVPNEHFYIVTLVSVLAFLVAVLVARAAVHLQQFQVLLVALGFLSMAGFFAVHALHTPGIMFGQGYGGGYSYENTLAAHDYSGTVVGLSGFLSVFTAGFFFAAAYQPLARAIQRVVSGRTLALAVVGAVVGYSLFAAWQPEWLASLPLSRPPLSYAVVGVGVALQALAALQQGRVYLRQRRPLEGALTIAFLLLAEAEAMMLLPPWSLMWWGYHLNMLLAVVIALTALFVELDRRRGLERFLPREVVERVVTGDLIRLAGERRTVTVLFADLRDSTNLAEELSAEDTVEFLNAYVGAMARCVFDEGGMLDKFLGDGLMALFGVLPDEHDGAAAAVRAAARMRDAISLVSRTQAAHGLATRVGVGIHTGEVVLGAVGIPQRSDFTAIGDVVNTAARVQSDLCKQFGAEIVLTRETADRLPSAEFHLRALGTATLRGRREPVEAFALE